MPEYFTLLSPSGWTTSKVWCPLVVYRCDGPFGGTDKLIYLARKTDRCASQILSVGLMDLNLASSIVFAAKAILIWGKLELDHDLCYVLCRISFHCTL
jgi:hypothetical protein